MVYRWYIKTSVGLFVCGHVKAISNIYSAISKIYRAICKISKSNSQTHSKNCMVQFAPNAIDMYGSVFWSLELLRFRATSTKKIPNFACNTHGSWKAALSLYFPKTKTLKRTMVKFAILKLVWCASGHIKIPFLDSRTETSTSNYIAVLCGYQKLYKKY